MRGILGKVAAAKEADLEAWETALRAAVLSAGGRLLEGLLQGVGSGKEACGIFCSCGIRMESRGLREKELLTILGPVRFRRSMFQCPACHATRYPGDEALDLVNTTRSPGVRRMMARAGSRTTFKEGREDLKVYAGLEVSAKDVERVAEGVGQAMEVWARREREKIFRDRECGGSRPKKLPVLYVSYDGTGVPMIEEELRGRAGKQADGSARTREAKLGCVFSQTTTDAKGFPVRDPDSTSYVGAIETSEDFGWRIYAEAERRGLSEAQRVIILADGAKWNKSVAEMHFPEARFILDLYHARQHVSELCKALFPGDEKSIVRQRVRWWTDLDAGKVEKILRQAKELLPQEGEGRKKAEMEMHFLEQNKESMRYDAFRGEGLFVGSGVVEAGCKTLIGQRLKQAGMEWSLRGANAIISLRCMIKSGRFEEYWESRAG